MLEQQNTEPADKHVSGRYRRKRILFVGESIALAHVARPAVLARWSAEAGHDVFFACGRRYADAAAREDLSPRTLKTIDGSLYFSRLNAGHFMYSEQDLEAYIKADLELIDEVQPDLVVGDMRLSLPVAAELAGLRCLSLTNAHLAPTRKVRLPAPEQGWPGRVPASLRNQLFSWATPLVYRFWAAPLSEVRRKHGLPRRRDFREYYCDGDACAYLDVPEFAVADPVPDDHAYVGPIIWKPRGAPRPDLEGLGKERPLVYVTLGSTGNKRWLGHVLRELLASGCDMVVSGTGPSEAKELMQATPGLPSHCHMSDFFDPSPVLARATLTICHGGNGTVYQSLESGVPVLCFPGNCDQSMVTQCVEAAGVGLTGSTNRLHHQIGTLLSGVCSEATRNMSAVIRHTNTRHNWLAMIGTG